MVGELIAGRYELEELVGRGGMSNVYRARDRLLERTVAIKVLHEKYTSDDDYVERFRREARSAAQLTHPNIVTVIDRGEDAGRQYIVFEFVDGENLKEHVERRGRLDIRRALELGIQTGRALAFAHAQGLIHRDVKPQNVLLANGEAKVTDFGIARSLDLQRGMTQTGTVLGTSDYIAPEQARGEHVDDLSDVYSLGVLLFELLTGEVPYHGDSFLAVAMRHVNEPVPSVAEKRPDVPLRLAGAVERALAKEPEERFPSMEGFVDELEAVQHELGTPDQDRTAIVAPRAAGSRPRPARRHRRIAPLIALVLGLAAIGGVTAAFVLVRDDGSPSAATGTVSQPIRLAALATHDPEGDGHEHDERVAFASDGDPATYWETERYHSGLQGAGKSGVGLVFDAGRPVEAQRLTLVSDTPGYIAEIKAGSSPATFTTVSTSQMFGAETAVDIRLDQPYRYFLVWITDLAPDAPRTHINEVKAG